MRKSTIIHYSEGDVHQIVRDELQKAGLDKIPTATDKIFEILSEHTKHLSKLDNKMDRMIEIMDTIAKSIKDFQFNQSDELEKIDFRVKKLEHPAL